MCAKSPRIRSWERSKTICSARSTSSVGLADPLPAEPRDLLAGLDERAEGRRLLDDLRVVVDVRRRRNERRELGDARAAADLLELAPLLELVRERDRVDRLALRPEREHRAVDRPVRAPVEVGGVEDLGDGADRRLGEQHRPEHRLLGLEVLRRHEGRRRCMRGAHGGGSKPSRRAASRRAVRAGRSARAPEQAERNICSLVIHTAGHGCPPRRLSLFTDARPLAAEFSGARPQAPPCLCGACGRTMWTKRGAGCPAGPRVRLRPARRVAAASSAGSPSSAIGFSALVVDVRSAEARSASSSAIAASVARSASACASSAASASARSAASSAASSSSGGSSPPSGTTRVFTSAVTPSKTCTGIE